MIRLKIIVAVRRTRAHIGAVCILKSSSIPDDLLVVNDVVKNGSAIRPRLDTLESTTRTVPLWKFTCR